MRYGTDNATRGMTLGRACGGGMKRGTDNATRGAELAGAAA
jgi:hypothetical protein